MCETARNLYFDNAATSFPKPEEVYLAAEKYLRHTYGNPGRSGYARSLEADRVIYRTRELLSRFFNAGDPARIVFTLNATDALNMAIKGLLEPGDHVLCTAMDHNSVLRPLGGLRRAGLISVTVVPCSREGFPDLDYMERSFTPRTRLVVSTHASNVTGTILPVAQMADMAHRKGALFLLDAAQTAGALPIDLSSLPADLMTFAGHKGLLGPPGTGGLYVRPDLELKPWREGGTGSHSEMDEQPADMPERLEAGTLNGPGLAGLYEGIRFIIEQGVDNVRRHEIFLRTCLRRKLEDLPGVTLFGPDNNEQSVAVLSLTVEGIDSGELGHILESSFNIITRSGLHCAPLAHQAIGTFPRGTLRLSPGYFTKEEDIDFLAGAISEITRLAGN